MENVCNCVEDEGMDVSEEAAKEDVTYMTKKKE